MKETEQFEGGKRGRVWVEGKGRGLGEGAANAVHLSKSDTTTCTKVNDFIYSLDLEISYCISTSLVHGANSLKSRELVEERLILNV